MAGVVLVVFLLGLFESLELLTYDWRFVLRGERKPHDDILIISMDEESQDALQQRFPWKRSIHTEFVNRVMQHNPALIVYDVIFNSPTDSVEDEAFANALYDAYDEEREMSLVVLAQYISQRQLEQPLGMFADNAGGLGLINLYKDVDDIVRSTPVVQQQQVGDMRAYNLWLAVETATLYKGGGINTITSPQPDTFLLSRDTPDQTEEVLHIVAPQGRLYINFIGGSHSYPTIPFWKILKGEFEPEEIEGKVILIGDTMLTSHDYYLTPFRKPARAYLEKLQQSLPAGTKLPKTLSTFGIEIHAQAFQTLLEQSAIRTIPRYWSMLFILVIGTVSGILLFQDRRILTNTAVLAVLAGGVWAGAQYAFTARYVWIDLAPLEVVILLNYVAGLAFQRSIASYNRQKIKGAFQHYVSAAVVEEMLEHPEKLQLGGERKFLSVLFSDIRGFTSISELMESQELVEFLNEYLTAMTEIVMEQLGTLDKYMGDAIMAIYGAPVDQADHAFRACVCALKMMERLHEMQAVWQSQGKPPMNIGIGVNSGSMTVGNMGSQKRFDFTVMGDHVNLASRLEGTNKQYGTNIIISEFTYGEVSDRMIVRELDMVRVKGKQDPVRIYELVGQAGQVTPQTLAWIDCFHQGLSAYRRTQWEQAIAHFERVQELKRDDPPASLYIQRCETYQHTPPPLNWDGVYIMTTK